MRVGGRNPKSVWWNAVKRKEAAWKEVLGARDEERYMEGYREEKRKVKK